jgi:hypothetical protein
MQPPGVEDSFCFRVLDQVYAELACSRAYPICVAIVMASILQLCQWWQDEKRRNSPSVVQKQSENSALPPTNSQEKYG